MTLYRYSHFHNDTCVLFTNEDYLPPEEAEDVALPMVDLQELLEPACPRCDKVSKNLCLQNKNTIIIYILMYLTETREEDGQQLNCMQKVFLQILR